MSLPGVVIVDGVRTAIGSFEGSLSSLTPDELGAAAEVITRSGVDAKDIDHAVFGHIMNTGPQDAWGIRWEPLAQSLS
jgi:acetyl-CoA C-acetyltransferase